MTSVLTEFLMIIILAALLFTISAVLSTGVKIQENKFLVIDKAHWLYQVIFGLFAVALLCLAISSKVHEWAGSRAKAQTGNFYFSRQSDDTYGPHVSITGPGGGLKVCIGTVHFSERFTRAPLVVVSLSGFDVNLGTPNVYKRIEVTTENVTPDSFDIKLNAWATPVALGEVRVSWMAIEQ